VRALSRVLFVLHGTLLAPLFIHLWLLLVLLLLLLLLLLGLRVAPLVDQLDLLHRVISAASRKLIFAFLVKREYLTSKSCVNLG
jgi:hypothetical protein